MANDEYDAEQMRLKEHEHEQKLLAREQELRDIVANTNDKLIDISMINNSGIVIQGTDLQEALDKRQPSSGSAQATTHQTAPRTNTFTLLTSPDSAKISKEQLKKLHSNILNEIFSQSQVNKPGPLTVPF
uniref:Protein MEH1 n=1 Tax=Saccharomyces cerevisiae (strain ATCC 204508 / S288c) TaxID=559292 RepID=UPI0012E0C4A1|nr:Chain C, Protein MEH1 [Saccharomyces cerevisiae S288C]6JWP_H Chain H, Protein MEH1 [Saccharomyces cerevisiae S288C]